MELFHALLLDGDRRANHTFFYQDSINKAEWTLAAGEVLVRWYDLDCDNESQIHPEHLREKIQIAVQKPRFLPAFRQSPLGTLSKCYSQNEVLEAFSRVKNSLSSLPFETVQYVSQKLSQDSSLATVIQLGALSELSAKANLSDTEREKLFICSVREKQDPGVGGYSVQELDTLQQEADIIPSTDQLFIRQPKSRLGCLLADAQQAWLVSSLVSQIALQKHPDFFKESSLDELRHLVARSPWYSAEGKKYFKPKAQRQETKLRSLLGLVKGIKTPKREKLGILKKA
jgi:hypothetical protein